MRVLVADDDPVARRVLVAQLVRWGYEVEAVADGDAAAEALARPDAPRLAVLDWEMPGTDGVEVCRRLREGPAESYTYVLLVTGREGRKHLLDGLDAGADDYVTKPVDPSELRARLRTGSRITSLQTQLLQAGATLRHQATHDGLTGVLNRVGILDALEARLAEQARRGGALGVLMVDLDHFKGINDAHGHAAGDAVLREVARRATGVLRPYDLLGRVGGEEFLVVLPGCNGPDAVGTAERLRAALSAEPIAHPTGTLRVTCSIGVATTTEPVDADTFVRAADEALYRAKRSGRDRVVSADVARAPFPVQGVVAAHAS